MFRYQYHYLCYQSVHDALFSDAGLQHCNQDFAAGLSCLVYERLPSACMLVRKHDVLHRVMVTIISQVL